MQDNIYVIRQFAYIHGVAEISLLLGKTYKVQQYSILVSQEWRQYKTLITKNGFSSCAQDSQWATKRAKIFLSGVLPPDP